MARALVFWSQSDVLLLITCVFVARMAMAETLLVRLQNTVGRTKPTGDVMVATSIFYILCFVNIKIDL